MLQPARVVDVDTGKTLGLDAEGLLQIKGPNGMKGYLNHPEKTAELIQDGWYNTGDMATIDQEGFITITGRQSRFSKIGGEMVLHIRVEELLTEIVENPRDEVSWYRLLRLLLGVGDATARAAIELLAQHGWEPMAIGAVRAPARARPGLLAMSALFLIAAARDGRRGHVVSRSPSRRAAGWAVEEEGRAGGGAPGGG